MSHKDQRFEEIIRELAGTFLAMESNRKSLITVTKVEVLDRGNNAKIFFTVFPDNQQKAAMDFVKRKRGEFREYVKENARLMKIPFFEFEIDAGEKARQKTDESISAL